MKRALLLVISFLLAAHVAAADHISVYSDATGSSCYLAPGFTTTAAVVHKFTLGATGSRFRLEVPAGSTFFAFVTPFPVLGVVQTDGTVNYGQCLLGSFAVGTITALLTQGTLWVKPAAGFSDVMVRDCDSGEKTATCGSALVGGPYTEYCPSCQTVATDQKTWGAVKALYRE